MGPEGQGQHAPGRKGLEAVLGPRALTSALGSAEAEEALLKAPDRVSAGPPITYPGHLNPVLQHFGPVLGLHAWDPKAGGGHKVDQMTKMCDAGTNSGCQVLLARLVPPGPYKF